MSDSYGRTGTVSRHAEKARVVKTNAGVISAAWAMLGIVAVTFVIDLLIMLLMSAFGLLAQSVFVSVISAAVLSLSPCIVQSIG